MNDAMVTARMSQAKKEAGGRVLAQIGSNASQVINDVYDYLIEHGSSPCSQAQSHPDEIITPERITAALSNVESMCLPADNRFSTMTDDDIERERLVRRGLWEG